ncbi:hypothetical protein HPB51_007498 [Rhipicephalus microplus]|uniref:Uncharacterized protein n=1 Tax=Rhipicephalus microplus TaxID=6941 RepID=A0A9J6DTX4_RHIMP|nr:hypothetical protein HPB51_007498 [Rhipicephalus microplus]
MLNQKERDVVRLAIDKIERTLRPRPMPQSMAVEFGPVLRTPDDSQETVSLFVVEVIVRGAPDTLYITSRNGCYLRDKATYHATTQEVCAWVVQQEQAHYSRSASSPRSRDPPGSIGALRAFGIGVVSIASGEATSQCEVSRKSLTTLGQTFTLTRSEADGIVLLSTPRWLLPVPAEAGEGEAALAVCTVSGCGGTKLSVRVAQAVAVGVGASSPRAARLSCWRRRLACETGCLRLNNKARSAERGLLKGQSPRGQKGKDVSMKARNEGCRTTQRGGLKSGHLHTYYGKARRSDLWHVDWWLSIRSLCTVGEVWRSPGARALPCSLAPLLDSSHRSLDPADLGGDCLVRKDRGACRCSGVDEERHSLVRRDSQSDAA